MTQKQKFPGPLYAAAGFGDFAAEKLRELPEQVAGLGEWARTELSGSREKAQGELADLGERVGSGLASFRTRAQQLSGSITEADVRRFSENARRRAGEFATVAQENLITAQNRAVSLYDDMVSRGANVLDGEPAKIAKRPAQPAKKMAKKTSRPAAAKKSTAKKS
ncbi:MAG: hypothetical protein WCA46_17765 [Actinocatenispora sp.]